MAKVLEKSPEEGVCWTKCKSRYFDSLCFVELMKAVCTDVVVECDIGLDKSGWIPCRFTSQNVTTENEEHFQFSNLNIIVKKGF